MNLVAVTLPIPHYDFVRSMYCVGFKITAWICRTQFTGYEGCYTSFSMMELFVELYCTMHLNRYRDIKKVRMKILTIWWSGCP